MPDRATANPLKPMRKRRDWAARPRGTMLDAERYTRFVSDHEARSAHRARWC